MPLLTIAVEFINELRVQVTNLKGLYNSNNTIYKYNQEKKGLI
jgi:hypothetical protein